MPIHNTPTRQRSQRIRRLIFGTALFAALAALPFAKTLGLMSFPPGFEGLTPASDRELGAMRGGFVFPNGMVLTFQLRFRTFIDGFEASRDGEFPPFEPFFPPFEPFTELSEELMDFTGVINTVIVTPGEPPEVLVTVEPTNEITGVMNVIQNNASGVIIENQNSLTINLSNVNLAITASQANNLAFRLRSLSLFGL